MKKKKKKNYIDININIENKKKKLYKAFKTFKKENKLNNTNRINNLIFTILEEKKFFPSSNLQIVDERLYIPDLESKPWHEINNNLKLKLEKYYPIIKEELKSLILKLKNFPTFLEGSGYLFNNNFTYDNNIIQGGEWRAFFFHSAYRKKESSKILCPKTSLILDEIKVSRESLFSVLSPNMHLKPHSDKYNFVLTLHLGLEIPENCGIKVGNETRFWEEGKSILFDSSYIHEAWNFNKDHSRIVLLIDIWHPDLLDIEINFLNYIRPYVEDYFGLIPNIDQNISN